MGKPLRSNTKKTCVKSAPEFSPATPKFHQEPIEPLSAQHFCDFIISESTSLSQLFFPNKFSKELPNTSAPAVITYGKNTWKTTLNVVRNRKSLDYKTWKDFMAGTKLKNGDGLVLELMDKSEDLVKFKAQILRGNLPAELEARMGGVSPDTPIVIE